MPRPKPILITSNTESKRKPLIRQRLVDKALKKREHKEQARQIARDAGLRALAGKGPQYWYILQVSAGLELLVMTDMHRMGVPCYVIMNQVFRRKHRTSKARIRKQYPALPGYVMIAHDEDSRALWRDIVDSRGVLGVLGGFGKVARFSAASMRSMVTSLESQCSMPAFQAHMRTHAEFVEGDTVRIVSGPFQDCEAPVMQIKGEKTQIKQELFGATRKLWIDTDNLERVG